MLIEITPMPFAEPTAQLLLKEDEEKLGRSPPNDKKYEIVSIYVLFHLPHYDDDADVQIEGGFHVDSRDYEWAKCESEQSDQRFTQLLKFDIKESDLEKLFCYTKPPAASATRYTDTERHFRSAITNLAANSPINTKELVQQFDKASHEGRMVLMETIGSELRGAAEEVTNIVEA